MGKCCWITSLAIQQMFPIQNPLAISDICHQILYSNATDLKLDNSTYFFSTCSVSSIHEVLGTIFKGG